MDEDEDEEDGAFEWMLFGCGGLVCVCVCLSSRPKRPHLTLSSPLLNYHPLEFDEEDEDEDGALFI